MEVQRLFIYPIKSLGPVEVSSLTITPTGLLYDRSFVLVIEPDSSDADSSTGTPPEATHITIKTTSQLCLFHQSISEDFSTLTITHKLSRETRSSSASIIVPLQPSSEDVANAKTYSVKIFGSTAMGHDMGSAASTFFTTHLPHLHPKTVRLLYIGECGSRPVPASKWIPQRPRSFPLNYIPSLPWPFPTLLSYVPYLGSYTTPDVHPQNTIQFHDGAPILITTTASELDAVSRFPDDFAEKHQPGVTIERFRPNIHVSTPEYTTPYVEETWSKIVIRPNSTSVSTSDPDDENRGDIKLDLVFNTIRCMSLNVDFHTGGLLPPDRQLYKLLTKDRRVNKKFPAKPCFGRYAFTEPLGAIVEVGDVVEATELVEGK